MSQRRVARSLGRLTACKIAMGLVVSLGFGLASMLAVVPTALADQHQASTEGSELASQSSEHAPGRLLTAEEASGLPPVIHADGEGLPDGYGDAPAGAAIYAERCSGCHGGEGQGGSALELVGDRQLLASEYPDRGIAVFWPYAPPLYDYVRRAMPPEQPWSLSADDTYAVIAHLLDLNGLLPADQRVDAAFLSNLVMPNRDGFIDAR